MDDENKSTQMTEDEARAAFHLSSMPEWHIVAAYFKRCLSARQLDLETLSVDKTPGLLASAQGECKGIRSFLGLRERSEKVIEGARNRVKPRA